jgi:hypothetical protein
VLAWIMGIHGVDDYNYNELVTKPSIRGKLIITNGSCVLDTLYFLTKYQIYDRQIEQSMLPDNVFKLITLPGGERA